MRTTGSGSLTVGGYFVNDASKRLKNDYHRWGLPSMKVVRTPDPEGTESHIPTVSRLQIHLQVDPAFSEREVIDLTTFRASSVNPRDRLLKGFGGHTESCEGNGHHLSSNAGPLSMHITISQRISPLSSSDVSAPSDGPRLHSCIQAREGRGILMPISGE